MATITPRASPSKPIGITTALGIVLLIWAAYTTLQTLSVIGHVTQEWSAVLGFVPGILGVGAGMAAGLSREDCFLRLGRLSWRGFAALSAIFVFALGAILPVSTWQGWSWTMALIYAPASGISQELFFRAALLPVLRSALRRRPGLALLLHSALFGLWHSGPLFVGAPVWAVIAVMAVPFLSGLG